MSFDPPINGSVGPNDVLVEYAVGSIDEGVHNRREIRHYLLNEDITERVDPFVLNPRDFVDAWIQRPWSEVSRLTESNVRSTLEKRHAKDQGYLMYGEFTFPTFRCEEPDLWQVGISLHRESEKERLPEYFLIRWRPPYHFTMVNVGALPWPRCTQEDQQANEFRTLFPGNWH